MKRHPLIALVCLFVPGLLFCEKRSMRIRWSAVPGATGYAVEWQGKEGRTEQQKTATSEITLQLEAGQHRIRVAALNRFGKPARWSSWKAFVVEDISGSQSVHLNRPQKKKKPVQRAPLWKRSIPGWIQIERGQWHGWAYPAALGALAYYAWDQKNRGDRIASDVANDPDFIIPLTVYGSA